MPLVPSVCSDHTPPTQMPQCLNSVGVAIVPAVMDGDPVAVAQQHDVGVLAHHRVKAIDLVLGLRQEVLHRFAGDFQLVLRDDVRRRKIPYVDTIVEEASSPGAEYFFRFGQQIFAADVQLDAVTVRQSLR